MKSQADKNSEKKGRSIAMVEKSQSPNQQVANSDTVQLKTSPLKGIVTEEGGLNSNSNTNSELPFAQTVQRSTNNQPERKDVSKWQPPKTAQRKERPNRTGLPENLKTGIEQLSGFSMDNVQVHYNSEKPAQLNAHAYTQGTDIHVASGQEKHLPHEAWHVVQQKQGRVSPTTEVAGKPVNDNMALESEADVMGHKAIQFQRTEESNLVENNTGTDTVQKKTVGRLRGYAGQYVDAGNGLYVAPNPTDLYEVTELVEAIRAKMHADKKYQKILILSGCHGDDQGNLYKESSFYGEDLFNEGAGPVKILAQNVARKSKRMLAKEIENTNIVRVLGWCYSRASLRNWDAVTADWKGF